MVQANENIKSQQGERLRVAEMARRVAVNVVKRQEQDIEVGYDRACSYYGALCFAEATGDGELRERIEVAYTPCLSGEIKPKIKPGTS